MGFQEYLFKLNSENRDTVLSVFRGEVQCVAKVRKQIAGVKPLLGEAVDLQENDICAVISGDRYEIREKLVHVFPTETYFYSENVNEAATGTYFPTREQVEEFFCDMSVINYETGELIREVREKNKNTPDGAIRDADTLLNDVVEAGMKDAIMQETGIFEEITSIWENAEDKHSVEEMFFAFTNMNFMDYLKMCKNEITEGDQKTTSSPIVVRNSLLDYWE